MQTVRGTFDTGFLVPLLLTVVIPPTAAVYASTRDGYRRPREYCESESFRPRCGEGEVIVMQSATYGRMRLGRCVTADLGYLGCASNVLAIIDLHCSGRPECQIRIPDPELDSTKPCFKELKIYLAASFTCVPVLGPSNTRCHSEHHVRVRKHWGYLASLTTLQTDCGSKMAPWVLYAPEDHRLNITLFDFAPYSKHQARYFSTEEHCIKYGEIIDDTSQTVVPVCRGGNRIRHIYLSKGKRLTISILHSKDETALGSFLLRYEVVGCRFTGDCEKADDGEACSNANCTNHSSSGFHSSGHKFAFLGQGVSIAIILGITLAVSLIMLLLGATILKCHKIRWGPFSRVPRASISSEQERTTCIYGDHIDHYSGTGTTASSSHDYEIRSCYFEPRCRDSANQINLNSMNDYLKEHHPPTSKEGQPACSTTRGAPQRTTCTLEMETTSGLVLRGVVSNLEENERLEQRNYPACRSDCCEHQNTANTGAEGMNVYVFNDAKSHDALEQYSPESDRKVMII